MTLQTHKGKHFFFQEIPLEIQFTGYNITGSGNLPINRYGKIFMGQKLGLMGQKLQRYIHVHKNRQVFSLCLGNSSQKAKAVNYIQLVAILPLWK